jgi:hypothetical protein
MYLHAPRPGVMSSLSPPPRTSRMVDSGSVVLLLHIYCIYDSDMTHGGSRYSEDFIGVESQCYLGYSYVFSALKVHIMDGEVCFGILTVHHCYSFASSTKTLYQYLRMAMGRRGFEGRMLCCLQFFAWFRCRVYITVSVV